MILYCKRTGVNSKEDTIDPQIMYIYWDFASHTGGHLDKDKNQIRNKNKNISFGTESSFYMWYQKFKEYWEKPTTQLVEPYLEVDEGL